MDYKPFAEPGKPMARTARACESFPDWFCQSFRVKIAMLLQSSSKRKLQKKTRESSGSCSKPIRDDICRRLINIVTITDLIAIIG